MTKYKNGNTKTEIYYKNDSIKHGLSKTYYMDGSILAEEHFADGLQNGWSLFYDDEKNLVYKLFFKNGAEYGNRYFYYRSGSLEAYNCYDIRGENFYILKLDSIGNIEQEEGLVFSPNILLLDSNGKELENFTTKNLEGEYSASIAVIEHPFKKVKLVFGKLNQLGQMENSKRLEIKENTASLTFQVDNQESKEFLIVGTLENDKGETVLEDSLVLKF